MFEIIFSLFETIILKFEITMKSSFFLYFNRVLLDAGLSYLILSTFCISLQGIVAKFVKEVSAFEIVFYRSFFMFSFGIMLHNHYHLHVYYK